MLHGFRPVLCKNDRRLSIHAAVFEKGIKELPLRARIASALHESLGDDIDGLAAGMEDAELLMSSEFWE